MRLVATIALVTALAISAEGDTRLAADRSKAPETAEIVPPPQHLIPEPGVLAEKDDYSTMLSEVFADAYKEGVILRVVIVPSGAPERAAGLRQTDQSIQAFTITPSASIWQTEYSRLTRGHVSTLDDHGNVVSSTPHESPRHNVPSSYREITTRVDSALVPKDIASRIEAAWQKMLLAARQPTEPSTPNTSHHFSMWVLHYGVISAQGGYWGDHSKVTAFAALADVLADYARGTAKSDQLVKSLKDVER